MAKLIRRKQRRLANLINLTLVKSYQTSKLRYYQGYHDVACIFLAVLGGSKHDRLAAPAASSSPPRPVASSASPMDHLAASMGLDVAAAVLLRVSQSHLRDCLKTNFLHLQTALRLTLMPLLARLDPQVHHHLDQVDMEPFFALSWVITWFSHDIRDTDLAKRLFDCFLVSHPLFPIYMSVAMLIHPWNRQEILDCPLDFAMLHQCLTGLPKNSSMVGWKYSPGDGGYVSDDEGEEDDGTVSTQDGTDVCVEEEFLLVERNALDEKDGNVTGGGGGGSTAGSTGLAPHHRRGPGSEGDSLVSSNLSSLLAPVRVSFQELIELAIDIMARVPPRKLVPLATRYYSADPLHSNIDTMLQDARDIVFLQRPPTWALQRTLPPPSLVLKQPQGWSVASPTRGRRRASFHRDTFGSVRAVDSPSTASTGSMRRVDSRGSSLNRLEGMKREHGSDENDEMAKANAKNGKNASSAEEAEIESYLRENNKTMAVIALGFGPGDDEEKRRRKRRKLLVYGAVATVVVAIAVGVAMQTYEQQAQATECAASTSSASPSDYSGTVETLIVDDVGGGSRSGGDTGSWGLGDGGSEYRVLSEGAHSQTLTPAGSPTIEVHHDHVKEDIPAFDFFSCEEPSSPFQPTLTPQCVPEDNIFEFHEPVELPHKFNIRPVLQSPLQPTWSADAGHYVALYSAAKRVSAREASRAKVSFRKVHEGVVLPLNHLLNEVRPKLLAVTWPIGPTIGAIPKSVRPAISALSQNVQAEWMILSEDLRELVAEVRHAIAGNETRRLARSLLDESGKSDAPQVVKDLARHLKHSFLKLRAAIAHVLQATHNDWVGLVRKAQVRIDEPSLAKAARKFRNLIGRLLRGMNGTNTRVVEDEKIAQSSYLLASEKFGELVLFSSEKLGELVAAIAVPVYEIAELVKKLSPKFILALGHLFATSLRNISIQQLVESTAKAVRNGVILGLFCSTNSSVA